ncbi:MAG: hypothetical protein H0T39_02175 [Actinobacteria bacterium]|nr:hypothetical protein [Actinomycetota bacterium]
MTLERVDAHVPERLGDVARCADGDDNAGHDADRDHLGECRRAANVAGKLLEPALLWWGGDDDPCLRSPSALERVGRGVDDGRAGIQSGSAS